VHSHRNEFKVMRDQRSFLGLILLPQQLLLLLYHTTTTTIPVLKFLLKWPTQQMRGRTLQNLHLKCCSARTDSSRHRDVLCRASCVWVWWVLLQYQVYFTTVGWHGDRQSSVCAGKHHAAEGLLWCEVSL